MNGISQQKIETENFTYQDGVHIISAARKTKFKEDNEFWKKMVTFGYWLGDQEIGLEMAMQQLRIKRYKAKRYVVEIRAKLKRSGIVI